MKLPRRRPRYADIVATLALCFALGGTAYAVTQIDPDSVYTDAIQDKAVTVAKLHNNSVNSAKLVDGTVGNSELASNAVTGAKVANDSLSLADLVGANVNGAISFSLDANTCGSLTFGVSGAQVGEVVLMSYTGTVAVPPAVVWGLARVTAAGSVSQRACNVSSSSVSVSSLGVHIITFG